MEPVTAEVEEAAIRPVTGGQEEDQEEKAAIYAWPVEEIGADKEEEDKGRGGIRWYEEEREPARGS